MFVLGLGLVSIYSDLTSRNVVFQELSQKFQEGFGSGVKTDRRAATYSLKHKVMKIHVEKKKIKSRFR